MAFLEVIPSQLKSKAEELRALNSSLKNEIINLELTEETLRSKWSGEANEKFHTTFVNDKIKIDNFVILIEQYIQAMSTISGLYEKAENSNCETLGTRRY